MTTKIMSIKLIITVGITILLIMSAFLAGCTGTSQSIEEPVTNVPIDDAPIRETQITPSDLKEIPSRGFYMGILPLPKKGQSFDDVYSQISKFSDFVPVWGRPTPFYNMAQDLSGDWGRAFVKQYIRGNNMFPLIHMSFMGAGMTISTKPGMPGASLSSPGWRQAYKQAALDIVRVSRPLYFSAGNEVNRWYEKYGTNDDEPNGFQHYVSLYEEIYDAVKKLSPETKVFCVFARETQANHRQADIEVLRMFKPEKIDVLVLTSYPHSVQGINKPSDIPDDYYSSLLKILPDKPLGFSELAWPSMDAFGGEQAQSDFIVQLTGRLTREQGVNLHMLGWPWLYDLNDQDYIGLVKRDGTEKQAYETWKKLAIPR